MSRCANRVAEILTRAESKKITDRRNFIRELQEVYLNEEYVEAINDETSKDLKGCVSWNEIMLTIHRLVLTEAEKPVNKMTKSNTAVLVQSGCCSLIKRTVNFAISAPKTALRCTDFMAMIFEIFAKKTYEPYYDTYVGVLSSFLAIRTYRSAVDLDQWREILSLCERIYFHCQSDVKRVILEIARTAVQYGCEQSRLLPEVKKLLPFLERIYQEVSSSGDVPMRAVYKLTYSACQQMATENRITLCEFSERILPAVITLEGCPEKYSMLLLLVRIHHPAGAGNGDERAYAWDWEKWKNIVRGIYASVVRDTKPDKFSANFLKLACEVYRLTMTDHSYITEATQSCSNLEETQPRKRRRLSLVVRKPVDMLLGNDLEVTWLSVQILTILLRKYPDTLKPNEYEVFLKTTTDLVIASLNNEKSMDSLCELCAVLVNGEKEHWPEAEKTEAVRICWEKIWDTILRALSMNQNEKFGHALLQSMIEQRGVLIPNGILRLYLTDAMRWSSSSVKTLLTFCEYTPIPDTCNVAASSAKPEASARITLLQWSLDVSSLKPSSQVPIVDLSNLLTALVVRSWYDYEFRDFRKFREIEHQRGTQIQASMRNDLFDDREEKYFNDIEYCNLSLNFRQNDAEAESDESRRANEWKPRVICVQEALEHLIGALNNLIGERVDDFESIVTRLNLVARVLTNFAESGVCLESQSSKLLNLFEQRFKKMCSLLVANEKTLKFDHLVRVIEALEMLYGTRYDRDVSRIVINSTSMNFLERIFDLLSDDHEESGDEDSENSPNLHGNHSRKNSDKYFNTSNERSTTCRLRNSAYKILTYFCCTAIDDQMLDAQMRVLRNVMKISLYENTSNADLRRALDLLNTYGRFVRVVMPSLESSQIANNFIRQLLDSRIRDETAIRGILNVLPYFLQSTRFIPQVEQALEILSTINGRLTKKKYGPLVRVDFVKCIAAIVRRNPSLSWQTSRSIEPTPIMDSLVDCINDPYYIVRIQVARALYYVFASENLTVPSKVDFFTKIEHRIPELFSTEEIFNSKYEEMDEHETRTLTVVHVYAAVLRASKYLSSRALYSMIKLSVERDVKVKTIARALLHVTGSEAEKRRLIEANLHDLLSQWFEADYPLPRFPWTLAHCESQEDFSRRHIDTLLSIVLQRREFKQLAILCNNLDISFADTIENCFPMIMTQLMSMIVSDSADRTARVYAQAMYERLRRNSHEFADVKTFHSLLQDKFSDLLLDLVQRLRDDEHFEKMFSHRVFLPAIKPPNLTVGTIDCCVAFMEKNLSIEMRSLAEYLATDCPRVLEHVARTLFCNIREANCREHKLLAFHQYRYFGELMTRHLQKSYFDPMSMYVVRDTCYSLLCLTRDEELAEMACDYLHEFLRASMPGRSWEIKEILSYVVSSLVPLARSANLKGPMRILEYLIIDERESLGEAIGKLDSFPNVESFEAIKRVHSSLKYPRDRDYSLEEEIEHFLNATNVEAFSCSLEGLANVKNQLSMRKQELRLMYERLESLRGFAEDCASSTLHKFIYKLVQLTRSCDSDVSLEAAKCLGELGPADLTTMILRAENSYAKEEVDKVAMLTLRVTSRLVDYLIDPNTNLRRASSAALYLVLATPWGHDLTKDTILNEDNTIGLYIHPFVDREKGAGSSRSFCVDLANWRRCIDTADDLWRPATHETYDLWIKDLTSKLLDCFANTYISCLKPVCRESVEFSEILLPRLVNLIRSVNDQLVNDVCLCINRFFLRVHEALGETQVATTISESPVTKGDATLSHQCVRSMINVVNFMRVQSPDTAPLRLDYLYIAKAAQYCSAYFTSVLYAELWCQCLLSEFPLLQDKVPGSWISAIDCICELEEFPGKLLQSIVREAYLQIGDPDSIYGCGSGQLIDSSYRIQHYVHLGQWDKVMLAQDVEMSAGSGTTRGILRALQQSGLQSLLGRVIATVDKEQENVDDFMYETAWRLADWNLVSHHRPNEPTTSSINQIAQNPHTSDYYSSHYHALKCLREKDTMGLKAFLNEARNSLIISLRKSSLECSRTVYPILSQLRMLREIEDFSSFDDDSCATKLDAWRYDNRLDGHDFRWIEPILSQRLIIYGNAGTRSNLMTRALVETHLEMAKIAEEQGYLSIAARALDTLARKDLTSSARDELTCREAFLAWNRGDREIGRYLLRNLIKKIDLSANLRAEGLRTYGNWMAIAKSENPEAIIEKYYVESIETSLGIPDRSTRDTKILTDAQADLAQFADAQYQQIVEFAQSPQYESLLECRRLKNVESGTVTGGGKDVHRAMMIYKKQVTNDAAELENIWRDREKYLVLAARYYLMTLRSGDDHDLLLFRLVSLWLDNTFNDNLNAILDEQLSSVAAHKFIVLLPQLAPHMSNRIDVFTSKINDLMKRCATEHPHHTLPVLLAIMNTYKDNEFKPSERSSQRRADTSQIEPRVTAAQSLITELTDSPIRSIIRETNELSHALIALAYINVSESQARKRGAHAISRNQPIIKIRDYANVCVPTLNLPVKPSRNYLDIVGVREYVSSFDLPGGVNAPKKIICLGTDGVRRTQLVKGQDDLRQDAVMQQVCNVMNDMLRTSNETKRRKLHIRTYKIVPLSRRSGVLEWCENTLPISNVLCDLGDKRGMHSKYYPNDWSVTTCRSKLSAVDKAPIEHKYRTFLECCKNLHPAFHHFFMEKYPSAETWFERRLAYVRSVATTSMVGYMLGLGDRHFSNILIDQTTAEVIHIDFGIAFAQGKVLAIPETVPFRLTRDMEVAMGISGVEGVMRRSCEETVAVLRDRRKILITLLQVLLYDPLFSWAITPVETDVLENQGAKRRSGRFTDDRGVNKTNKLAERALLRIEQKLQGTEDGISSSISGQVERLIQQARDPMNLCRLYSGWQAYL